MPRIRRVEEPQQSGFPDHLVRFVVDEWAKPGEKAYPSMSGSGLPDGWQQRSLARHRWLEAGISWCRKNGVDFRELRVAQAAARAADRRRP